MPPKRKDPADAAAAPTVKKKARKIPEPSADLLQRTREGLKGKGIDEGIPASLCCPLTRGIFENPVTASDGRTYEQSEITKWISTCQGAGRDITSPVTREVISATQLFPARTVKESRDEYVMSLAKQFLQSLQPAADASARGGAPRGLDADSARPAEIVSRARSESQAVKSLSELGGMFSKLDDMRDILEESLKGWKPPKVVVIGSESSGKSSVLERLMMCPLLPRDEALCTRVPIHVHLRRSGQSELPRLEVYDEERKRVLRSQDVVPMRGYQDVSEEMGKILKEVGEEGVTSKRTIRLHIKNPNVPCLDLIDMPGLVTTANSVRDNVPAKTRQIITVCVPR